MVITIGPTATLRTIEEFREVLLDAFCADGAIEIDGSAVVEADLSLLQVLEAAARQAATADRSFRVRPDASPALTALVTRAGLTGTGGWTSFSEAGGQAQ